MMDINDECYFQERYVFVNVEFVIMHQNNYWDINSSNCVKFNHH